MIVRHGWVSPNQTIGKAWIHSFRHKQRIGFEVSMNWRRVMTEDRAGLVLTAPRRRELILTHVQRHGPMPDRDNLFGGMKFLIDEFKQPGLGLLWEDSDKFLKLEVQSARRSPIWKQGTHYVIAELFDV